MALINCQSAEITCKACGHEFTVDLVGQTMRWDATKKQVILGDRYISCKECGSKDLEPGKLYPDRRLAS